MEMKENARLELAELVLKMKKAEEQRLAAQLEAQAERNLEVEMLLKHDDETIGKAFRHYADEFRSGEPWDGIGDLKVLEAYRLICSILYLQMWEC